MGIFGCNFRFAHSAEAIERLRRLTDERLAGLGEPIAQLLQLHCPSSEMQVSDGNLLPHDDRMPAYRGTTLSALRLRTLGHRCSSCRLGFDRSCPVPEVIAPGRNVPHRRDISPPQLERSRSCRKTREMRRA
uniref:Uncharacterized protein n=1 Tax=Nonomuraea gerenzanensis TaxID=93944 RepID=A0A1M4ECC2_9ACTN|nr:hypothetical protein BN4615_P5932 [Nonomuraea gerenzanensis]